MKKHGSSINVDERIDNLFLLISGTSDVFEGLISYLYFKILNMTPVQYFNIENEDGFYSKNEIKRENAEYMKYKNFKYNKVLEKDIEEVIKYIREKAIKEGVLKKVANYYFIENHNKYDSNYIIKKIYNYYKERK